MTVVHTYFYIVVDKQRGCHSLKKNQMLHFAHVYHLLVLYNYHN